MQVENPIPFADSALSRALSTGHLHARYFGLLLAPWRLTADWSFACVPLVAGVADPRNVATAALYAVLACVAWTTLRLLATGGGGGGGGLLDTDAEARWACFVFVGLLAAPFLPSSNLLLYVGTFIGERLLYLPSVGFCLLLARLLTALEGECCLVKPINFVGRCVSTGAPVVCHFRLLAASGSQTTFSCQHLGRHRHDAFWPLVCRWAAQWLLGSHKAAGSCAEVWRGRCMRRPASRVCCQDGRQEF